MTNLLSGARAEDEALRELTVLRAAASQPPQSTRRAVIELGTLDGRDGFTLVGETDYDYAGWSVSAAGDVNGDGVADFLVGAPEYGTNDYSYRYTDPGSAYVVYGSSAGFSTRFDLGNLNGTNGFRVTDSSHYNGYYGDYGYRDDGIGSSVAALGDINGDGIDDIAVGARDTRAEGAVHVVFGSSGARSASTNAGSMDAATGFTIVGEASYDYVGYGVSAAGDVNGDGVADILIGAHGQDTGGSGAGAAYVVYGRTSGFVRTFDLSDLNGTNGFVLDGDGSDYAGRSVAAAGDVNGDGVDDVLVGANGAGVGGTAYVVYGTASGTDARRDLSALTATEGFAITGASSGDRAGWSVAGLGDVNGDGADDVLVGADSADDGGSNSGAAYVVFGGAGAADVDVADLNGSNGFTLVGSDSSDYAGFSVAAAGDFNGDGHADLVIGARYADPNGTSSGEAYVVFGSDRGFAASIDLGDLDGSDGIVLRGANSYDYAGYDVSGAGDVNGDGYDDLIVGAYGADGGGSSSGEAYVVYGFASNALPTPQDDALTVRAGAAVSGDLFADNGDGADVDADGDALTVTAVNGAADGVGAALTLASGAVLTVGADGAVRLDTNGAHVALGEGETATEAFTYAVSDGLGGTATANVTVTVTGVNDAPQAAGESARAMAGTAPVTIDVLANDTDVDANDVLFVQSVSGGEGTAALTDGVVTYAADAFAALAEGESTLDTFSYVVADGHGGTDTGTVTVQVTGVNDAPEIGAVALALAADGAASFDLVGVAGDVDRGAVLAFAAGDAGFGTASVEGSVLTFAADGDWDALALGQTAEALLDVTVTDEHGAAATTAATLTITGVNDAPEAQALTLTAGQDDASVTADLTGFASDVDEGATLTFALGADAPEGATVSADGALAFALGDGFAALAEGETATRQVAYAVTDEHGASAGAVATLTITGANDAPTAAGAAFDALGAGETSTETVRYVVTDEHGASASEAVAVTVTGVNDAPTLTGGARRAVFTEDETRAVAIGAGMVFADVDSPDLGGAVITAQMTGPGGDWFVMVRGVGGITYSADSLVFDGAIIGTIDSRREVVSVTMADGTDADDLQAVLDALAFSGGVTDDPTEGIATVEVTVTDGAADDLLAPEGTQDGVASFTAEIEVVAVNDAPVAADDAEVATEKAQLVFDPRANDQDAEGDALAITGIDGQAVAAGDVVTLASGATVTLMTDGRLTYDPGEAFAGLRSGQAGTDGFAYALTDAGGAVSFGAVAMTVRGEDGGLVWSGTSGADAHGGTADADVLDGMGGDDVLAGGDGADRLTGGLGDDVLYGDGGPEAVAAAMAALAEAGLA